MKSFQVRIPRRVQDQITKQVIYIAEDSIERALAWEARLLAAIKKLSHMPGFAVDEEASERLGYVVHKLIFEGTYIVHFEIDRRARIVELVNFRHGARRPRQSEP